MTRVALVTGAGRGLGVEIALQLADQGLHVVLTSRNRDHAQRITDDHARTGRSLKARQLDVTDQTSVDSCIASVLDSTGRLDVLVNNAGISDGDQQAIEADLVLADQVWQVNVLGAWRCARAVIPAMTSAGYGRIVNVSSTMGSLAWMTSGSEPAYRVSKAGLNAVTRTLAAGLVGTGVLVNSASPGWVRTDLGGPRAPRDVTEGADTPVWLATLPDDGPTGGFFLDRRPLDW